jgi:hypothetical protein
VGVGVDLLVGMDVMVDDGLRVEVGARVGVTTVSVGDGVMLMALLQAEQIREIKIKIGRHKTAFIGGFQIIAMYP